MSRRISISIMAILVLASALAAQAVAVTTTDWVEYSSNPVYSPGKAYYPSVIKDGNTYTMWSDASSGVQMATSSDGINWTTVGVATGLSNVRHTTVEKVDNVYRMWYYDESELYSINAIRTATSTDGINWTNDQVITQSGSTVITGSWPDWNTGSYGPCDVIYNAAGSNTLITPVDEASVWANKYVMYYDGTTGADEFVGLAVSNDGVNWCGYNGGTSCVLDSTDEAWDAGYVSRCTVIKENDNAYHMWYSAGSEYSMDEGIGYAFSEDGTNWVKTDDPIFHIDDNIDYRNIRTYTPMVIGDEMWFSCKSSAGVYSIGYATAVPEPGTVILLLSGLFGMAIYAWRRRR